MSVKELSGKLAKTVVEGLQEQIRHGVYHVGDFLGTEVELAQRFGVSRTTVRAAMTYLEDQRMIRRGPDKGFQLTSATSATPAAEVKTRLLLIRAADIPLDNEVFEGVLGSPLSDKFDITMIDASGKNGNYADILNRLPAQFTHVLLFPLDLPDVRQAIFDAVARGVRIVQLDRHLEGIDTPAVEGDNYNGACLATRHLLEKHRLPVHYFGNHRTPTSAAKRFAGWRDTMARFGFDEPERHLVLDVAVEASDFRIEERMGADLDAFFAARPGEPLSLFAVNDNLAHLVHKTCPRHGRRLGADTFLVGFDGLELTRMLTPAISTVVLDRREIGREALRLLLEHKEELHWRRLVPVRLEIRDSSVSSE